MTTQAKKNPALDADTDWSAVDRTRGNRVRICVVGDPDLHGCEQIDWAAHVTPDGEVFDFTQYTDQYADISHDEDVEALLVPHMRAVAAERFEMAGVAHNITVEA